MQPLYLCAPLNSALTPYTCPLPRVHHLSSVKWSVRVLAHGEGRVCACILLMKLPAGTLFYCGLSK